MTDRLTPALLEIKRASITSEGVFSGYASTWDGLPDSYGDVIRKGAYLPALEAHKSNGTMPAMLWSHDLSEPIGKWLDIVEDTKGLLVTGKITMGTKRGSEAYALMKDNALSMSVGFNLAIGGTKTEGSIRTITKIARLGEISLVAIPANSNAKITNVKKPDSVREFQTALRGIGFSSRESKFVTTHGFRDLLAPGERSQHPLDTLMAEISALKEGQALLQRLLEERNL